MPPRVDVATLCEEHYHPGLAALLNSLVAAGFAGTAWVGHRGPRPAWADGAGPELALAPGVAVVFRAVDLPRHLSNAKAQFLADVLAAADPGVEGIAYLDPDIVVKHAWAFFAEWVAGAIAVCADIHPWFPASHPVRRAWRALAAELGDDVGGAPIELYVNAGFVGVPRGREAFLAAWERYIVAMAARGPGLRAGPGDPAPADAGRTSPFMVPDQDALNLAVMAHAADVSLMGRRPWAWPPAGRS